VFLENTATVYYIYAGQMKSGEGQGTYVIVSQVVVRGSLKTHKFYFYSYSKVSQKLFSKYSYVLPL
jgi:hypothetical protein